MTNLLKKTIFILAIVFSNTLLFIPMHADAQVEGAPVETYEEKTKEETTLASASLPKLTIPDLQIKIPTIKFTETDLQCANDQKKLCIPWIGEYIAGIYKYAIGIVGILAAVVLMWGGIVWLTAGGNQQRIGDAKSWITASISGLIIALSSYLILYQINPALVNYQPLVITIIEKVPIIEGGSESESYDASKYPAIDEKTLERITPNIWCTGTDCRVKKEMADALKKVAAEATKRGYRLTITSGYRSLTMQEDLFKKAVLTYGSEEEARKYVAKPSTAAPHVRGIAVDICIQDHCQGIGTGQNANRDDKWTQELKAIMFTADPGFSRYNKEWWHFEYNSDLPNRSRN
ncbi:MAG: D-alanyl-D-alanine carboxypeptidase family protein [Patescibacteria group bacterium]|nr:D-alanyl-D-alanine carboxypeptidase family protein [Patescibacteria group bacterium]MDD4610765.1 D-alanyl-D-alanine carboxypeptidase family protein [Patescibacteria group bacterium]